MFDLFEFLESLDAAALTVREQARIDNRDVDELLWSSLAPRQDVQSIKLSEMVVPDYRPMADRRNWGGDGRLIPQVSADFRNYEMNPIESFFQYGEKNLQRLLERFAGNRQQVLDQMEARIPDRVTQNVDAVYRRLEKDFWEAYLLGTIDVTNPQTGETITTDFQFDAARYPTEDWVNNNAYDLFLQNARDAERAISGGIAGAMLKEPILEQIQSDGPTVDGNRLTRRELRDRLQQELDQSFFIRPDSRSAEEFQSAGTERTEVDYFEPSRVAYIPSGGRVGDTAFAPIGRAYQYVQESGGRADERGVAVFPEVINNGKALKVEHQLNAMPIPQERFVWVVDTGIT